MYLYVSVSYRRIKFINSSPAFKIFQKRASPNMCTIRINIQGYTRCLWKTGSFSIPHLIHCLMKSIVLRNVQFRDESKRLSESLFYEVVGGWKLPVRILPSCGRCHFKKKADNGMTFKCALKGASYTCHIFGIYTREITFVIPWFVSYRPNPF